MAMEWRVVLVEPENPLNVGFVARAMKSFGASELVIAGSEWRKLPDEARVTGVSAPEILDGAKFTATLEDALRGCGTAIAFSRRPTDLRQNEVTLPASPSLKGKTALVFGRESKGLTRAETALCQHLARIPNQNGISLNLGQAVAVALFSLTATKGESKDKPQTASLDRMNAMWDFVHPKLAASPRFTEERQLRVRQLMYRLNLSDTDYDVLFSVMKAISK